MNLPEIHRPRFQSLPPFLIALLAIALLICGAEALDVAGFKPEINSRFEAGFPDAPISNPDPRFAGAGLDWSGVGWEAKNRTHNYCLITPLHFVYASHITPDVGESICFVNREGQLKTFTIAKVEQIGADGNSLKVDTGVGTLSEPIPASDHIAHYKIFSLGMRERSYIGLKLLMYGHMACIGTNRIVDALLINRLSSEFNYLTVGLSPGMAKTESGDSGSPSFTVCNGELALVGTHWKIDTDVLLAGVINGIHQIVAKDGYSVDVIDPSAH